MDVDIIDHICETYDLDVDTLHAHAAKRRTEDNKARHKHWKPPKGSGLPASDVRRMMAAKADIDVNGIKYSIKKASTLGQPTDVSIDGVTYSVSMALSTYHVSASRRSASGSLVGRGANGGIVGDDCRLIKEMTQFVNIEGIDDHVMERRLITAGATVKSNRGPVILIMNQYAHAGKGHTIHSSPQMEYYELSVDKKSRKVGGLQRITTTDGFVFAVNIRRGLPYLDMRPFTDKEWDELPHVTITHEADWDPEVLDNELSDAQDWFDSLPETSLLFPLLDKQGALRPHVLAQQHAVHTLPPEDDECTAIPIEDEYDINVSTNWCVYYANLHRMVPVDQADI